MAERLGNVLYAIGCIAAGAVMTLWLLLAAKLLACRLSIPVRKLLVTFVPKMVAARADLYRALETYTAILIQQYGNYSINANGQFVFADRSALDRFNSAANAVNVATTKLNELDAQRKQVEQSQKDAWKTFVSNLQ
jgi:ABC-type arginine/histidine transport system permease subunit